MSKIVRLIAIISGILVIVIPMTMSFLWSRYTSEQALKLADSPVDSCNPYQFRVHSVEKGSETVKVSWRTSVPCDTYLVVSEYSDFVAQGLKVYPEKKESTTDFSVDVPLKDYNAARYMVVYSAEKYYGVGNSPIKVSEFKSQSLQ